MMTKSNKHSLQICQVNISGLSKHSLAALDKYNHSIKNDILAVQETLLATSAQTPDITGMETFIANSDRGVMLNIQPWLLPQKVNELHDNSVDSVWATVKIGPLLVLIGNVYVNPAVASQNNLQAALGNLNKAIQYCDKLKIKDLLVLGDFNSRNNTWGDNTSNANGKTLEQYVMLNQLACLSPNARTFVCGDGGSTIDLAIVNNGKLSDLYQTTSVDSDVELFTGAPNRGHLPVIHNFKLPSSLNKASIFPTTIYKDLKKTDWDYWQSMLTKQLDCYLTPHLDNYIDPMLLWNDFMAILSHINDSIIPKKTATGHSKPFWNSELSEMSKEVQQARSKMMARHTPVNAEMYRVSKKAFADKLVKQKNNWIHEKLEGLNVTDSIKFWKSYKQTITGKTNDFIGNLYEDGILHTENSQKEKVLYEAFFSGKHMQDGNFDTVFGEQTESKYTSISQSGYGRKEDCSGTMNEPIRTEELLSVIKDMNISAKSFDIDDLHPSIIKRLPETAIMILLTLFNLALDTGVWCWNTSNVSFIRKAGKDNYMKPGSYRPITISSYIGKLLEKIIERRLKTFCEVNGIIDDEQEGFRTKRNTTRYLYKMISRLDESKRKKMTTFLLCIDFSKAFDSVWLNGLIVKLYNYNIKGKILNIIDTFLRSKQVRLKINNTYGKARACGLFGLPQGSVLSPLLFIIFISDMFTHNTLPVNCREHANIYKYADDGSVAVTHVNAAAAHRLCQLMCDHLSKWCSKWRMIPNCDKNKTECIVIEPQKQPITSCKLKIGSKEVNYVSKSTVLGLVIDDNLNFEHHASTKLSQCWFAWYNIIKNSNRKRGLNASSLTILFNAVVLTKLLYAAPVWMNKNMGKFKDLYSRAILKISGATHHPPREVVSIALNMAPLEIEYELVTIKFLLKAICSDDCMKGLIYQLEESRAHRFQHQVTSLKHYIRWKNQRENGISIDRKIMLLNVQDTTMRYNKQDIREFRSLLWSKQLDIMEEPRNIGNSLTTKTLFPRYSSRKIDTQVMSLLHGRDLKFMKFRFTITKRVSPFCQTCHNGLKDDNYHSLFVCPRFNSQYRDNIHNAVRGYNQNEDPILNILINEEPEIMLDLRVMAQLIMTK